MKVISYHEVHHDFKHTTYKDKEADNTDKKWTRVCLYLLPNKMSFVCVCSNKMK